MRRGKGTSLKPRAVVTSIVICAAICLAGIGYVWAKSQVWKLGRKQKELEVRLEKLKHDNSVLQRQFAAMCAPAQLDFRVRELKLGLIAPNPNHIIRMPSEFPRMAQTNSEPRIYAATNEE